MMPVALTVNGQSVQASVEPRTHLADFLREQQRLTGTHLGCEHGVCGACTVLLDGVPVRSCITYAVACEGRQVQTIEGFGNDPLMARLREAFSTEHALQCGFCTPGMLIMSRDVCRRLPHADEQRIRVELSGNLCRCTGYVGIVRAVKSVAGEGPMPEVAAEPKRGAVAPEKPALKPAAAQSIDPRKGWTRIEERFSVPHAPDEVWKVLADLPAATACLPGAELTEHDAHSAKGRIRIKFGPMSAVFAGSLDLERNDSAKEAVLHGTGSDSASNSRARGDISYRVFSEQEGRAARVEVTLDFSLAGPLAQFSRSGLVEDFAARLVSEFARNVSRRIAAPHAVHSAKDLRAGSLFLSVLWHRIRRAFRASD
jgi:carbon-monoxide dehydrogenase small subunit